MGIAWQRFAAMETNSSTSRGTVMRLDIQQIRDDLMYLAGRLAPPGRPNCG